MPDRTNAERIRVIKKWQEAGYVHPLTCGEDGCRAILDPVEFDNAVVLECPACGRVQLKIPLYLLHPGLEQRLDDLSKKIGEMRAAKKKDEP